MIASISWEALDAIGFETVKIFLSLLWQSSVLLGAVGLLTYALRHRRASLRHQLWVAALLITPVLPLLSWIASQAGTPQVQIPLVPAYAARRPQPETGSAEFTPADINTARPSADSSIGSPREQADVIGNDAAVPSPLTQSPSREEVSAAEYPWAIAMLIYLCGLGVFILLMAAGLLRIGKYIRQARILTEPQITGLFNAARRKLGYTRGCVVIETEAIQIPMTIRTFYPIVALPKDFASVLSNSEWRTVALHEVAHIKRNDPLLLSIVSVLRAVLFFHPLVWLAAREIFTLSEEATDDMVLEVVNKPLPYAKMLTRLTETLNRRMFLTELAVGIVFSKSVLLRRIEAILSDRSEQLRRLSRWTLAMTFAVAFGSLFLAVAVPLTSPGSTTTPGHAAGMVQRHLWNAPPSSNLNGTGGISPDGRYISYVDWTAGNLAVHDIIANVNWLVTKNTTWENLDGWAESSTISPDGKQIAYSWCNEKGLDFYDLRIIDLDGSNMRVLYHDASIFYIVPYDWSPDGKDILAFFADADQSLVDEKTGELFGKGHLVLVSVADGSIRILKTWHRRGVPPKRAFFSPDGRYIAYDFEQDDDRIAYDIYLFELANSVEVPLIEHPADDQLFGWTPDGRRIVFASDRSSKRGLWMIEVTDGVAQGSPRALLGQLEGSPIGFTTDGSFYYGVPTMASNVYITRLDSTGLNFEGEPELVSSQFVGSTTMAEFSPDGKSIVYRTSQGVNWSGPGNWILVVYSVETSGEHIVTPSPPFRKNTRMRGPRFSPDGRSLLVFGTGRESGKGLYTVDVETGDTALIESGSEGNMRQTVWSPDGKSIYIHSGTRISRIELATSQRTELYQGKWGPISFDVSPDGRWLAFYRDVNSLVLLPSAGGDPREVAHWDEEVQSNHPFARWMPDGEHLLFRKGKNELWKVHVQTGEQQQIGPAIEEGKLMNAVMNPDGRQIALTIEQGGPELWVMEDFLPD